jgi:hypothetical protein
MRLRRKNCGLFLLVVALITIKVVMAMVTPASLPVMYYLLIQNDKRSPDANNPWGRYDNAAVSVWYAFPIHHPDLETFVTNKALFLPFSLQSLLLLVKLPLIGADMLIAFVLFRLGKHMWPTTNRPVIALLLWLANPYATFVTEMLGAVDVIPVASIIVALYLLVKGKHILGATSLAAGIAIKLFPIVTVPAFLYSSLVQGSRQVKILISGALAICGLFAYVSWSGFPFSEAYYTQSFTEFILGVQSLYGLGASVDFIGLATFSVIISYLLVYEFRPAMFQTPIAMTLFVLLVYLAFLDFQVEYMLWLIPLFVIVNFTQRKTVPLLISILATAFTLGFFINDGYATTSGWTLLFFNRSAGWATSLLSSQFIDLVLRPLLRTLLSAFMILSTFVLWASTGDSRIRDSRVDQPESP